MGVNKAGLALCDNVFSRLGYSIRMFEFGDQIGRENGVFTGAAKLHWQSMGVNYVSLDLSGKNGALKRDITADNSDLGQFQLVTNLGSSEHVTPFEKQYETFKTLHELCADGGFMVHNVPPVGQWLTHCPAHYKGNFFPLLAYLNGYEMMYYKSIDALQLISCVFKKENNLPFIDRSLFPFYEIEWDESNPYKGNYLQKISNSG